MLFVVTRIVGERAWLSALITAAGLPAQQGIIPLVVPRTMLQEANVLMSLTRAIVDLANVLGLVGSPFDAYQTLRGLRTLHTRLRAHDENAQALLGEVLGHPAVAAVALSSAVCAFYAAYFRTATWLDVACALAAVAALIPVLLAAGNDANIRGAITVTDGNLLICAADDIHIFSAITLTRGTADPTRSLGLSLGLTLSADTDGSGPGIEGGTVIFDSLAPPTTVTAGGAIRAARASAAIRSRVEVTVACSVVVPTRVMATGVSADRPASISAAAVSAIEPTPESSTSVRSSAYWLQSTVPPHVMTATSRCFLVVSGMPA